jgi:hypothetical protein
MRASHIKTFRGHGSFISSNLVGETHVPRNAPGTPQANARFRPAGTHARSADESEETEEAAHRGQARGRSRSGAGPGRKQGGPSEREALEGESSAGLGRSRCSGEARARERAKEGFGRESRKAWGEGRVVGSGRTRDPRQAKRTVGPPDSSAAPAGLCRFQGKDPRPPRGTNDAIRPAPPPSQNAGGRSAGTPFLHGVRITRELRRARN